MSIVNFFLVSHKNYYTNVTFVCACVCLYRLPAVLGTVNRVCLQHVLKIKWYSCGESAKALWTYKPPSPALPGYLYLLILVLLCTCFSVMLVVKWSNV